MKSSEWLYRPNSINIETVQGCNRRCEFCGTMGMEKKIHYIDGDTLKQFIRLCKASQFAPNRIRLAGHGEPTLHKDLPYIIALLRRNFPKTQIHLFTNGTVIEKKPELVNRLFNAGLNNMIVDEYTDHRVGDFFRNNPICQKYNVITYKSGEPLLDVNYKKQRIAIVAPIDEKMLSTSRKLCNHLGAGMPPLEQPLKNKKCTVIFRELTIRHDGNVAICCNDFRGLYFVENIHNCKTLEEIWFHPRFESARKFLYRGDRNFFPCNLCNVLGNRVGLLPDAMGQADLEEPMKYRWGIPSYKRANSPLTVELLHSLGYTKDEIVVAMQTKEDYDEYRKKQGHLATIIYRQGTNDSINRNTLLQYFKKGEPFLLADDDIHRICRLSADGKTLIPYESRAELEKAFDKMFKYTARNNAEIWAWYPIANPFFMSHSINNRNILVGTIFGIINNKTCFFDEWYSLKGDFEISLRYIRNGKNAIRFNGFTCEAKHKSKGGCTEMRDAGQNKARCDRLLNDYAGLVSPHKKTGEIRFTMRDRKISEAELWK